MRFYNKIELPDIISISSVVTLFTASLSNRSTAADMHDFWELAYVRENDFAVLIDDVLYELKPGECIIYPPLSLHKGAREQNTVLDIVSFDSASPALSKIAGRVLKTDGEDRALIREILDIKERSLESIGGEGIFFGMTPMKGIPRELIYKLKKKIELLLVSVYAHETALAQTDIRGKKSVYSERLIAYLKMNINKTLTLKDIADELSISVSRLKTISGDILGTSPIDFFITMKIEAAMRLISDANLNFTEISDRLGFSSVHYFSKLFKKKLGITPSDFAKGIFPVGSEKSGEEKR